MKKQVSSKRIAFSILLLIAGMIMLTLASVPIYSIFCKITGYGGTVKTVKHSSDKVGTKMLTIRFDANIDRKLPWDFKSEQSEVKIRVGENNLIFYTAENKTDKPIIGTAIYNVTPHKAAKYFNKIQCFCFQEQRLEGKQKVLMPVSFFIDASIENDPNLADVDTITLSYSFYLVEKT